MRNDLKEQILGCAGLCSAKSVIVGIRLSGTLALYVYVHGGKRRDTEIVTVSLLWGRIFGWSLIVVGWVVRTNGICTGYKTKCIVLL